MNIVFLSPHFPSHYHPFCRQLRAAGANVLGIGDEAYAHLLPEIRDALHEYYRVEDMHDYDALTRACGYFTHRYGKIDRFESLNEYWLGTEARIRDDFNILGIRTREIDAVRRKSRMKEVFRQVGVPVARGRVVTDLNEARAFIVETGYPVVLKPDAGVGALNTHRIENDADLVAAFNCAASVDFIVEEFVAGELFSFDGLVDREGRLIFYTAHSFSQGIMETVNEDRHVSYHSLRHIPEELESVGRASVAAFDLRERFFHIEFFRTAGGRYVALEINMRPPGGYTTDMFNYANDIDIYRAWARLLVQGCEPLAFERRYHCCYASRKHRHRYRHSHEEIMSRYGHLIQQVVQVPGVFSQALGDIGYIFRSPEIKVVATVVEVIQAFKSG
ncbi:MAG: ATP-grasp domain-containing protein [Deltaproteobacteria bacterium]|nr:ATP-grasp domain-containing protein [Deltaproteobacteria bacterium]